LEDLKKKRDGQKNRVRKMKNGPLFALFLGGGASYISDPDISDIIFKKNPCFEKMTAIHNRVVMR
jgi:hypothetical protein